MSPSILLDTLRVIFCLVFLAGGTGLSAQEEALPQKRHHIGGYYSLLVDGETVENGVVHVGLVSQFFNVHIRSEVYPCIFIGWEGILAVVSSSERVENPFLLFGLHAEGLLYSDDRFDFFARMGMSTGNLSYAGPGVPERRYVVNVTFGGSIAYAFRPRWALVGGFYYHNPINGIPDSYAVVMPFLGIHYRL